MSERQTQQLRATEEQPKQTEELLAARPTEPGKAQAFLPTKGHLSEEALGIVRNLNITHSCDTFPIAVNPTEEWKKIQPSQVVSSNR